MSDVSLAPTLKRGRIRWPRVAVLLTGAGSCAMFWWWMAELVLNR